MRSPILHLEHLHTAARLWSHPRASREDVVRFRDRKLRVLIAHAARSVPLYGRLFSDAGVTPESVRPRSGMRSHEMADAPLPLFTARV